MRRARVILLAMVLLLSVTLAAYAATDYQVRLIKKFYSIGTASVNGTYYPVGNSIARLFGSMLNDIEAIAEPTAGSLANIEYLRRGQIDLALIQSDVAWMAFNGTHYYSANRFRELRILASLYSEVIQIVVRADSDIKTIHDLKGRQIAVGERESGSAASIVFVLSAAGMQPEDYSLVYERFTRTTESLRDGVVDAIAYAGAIPADGISRLAAKVPLRLIEVPVAVRDSLIKDFPYFSAEVITQKSYPGQEQAIQSVGFRALLAGTENLDQKEVEAMLQAIYANPEQISDQNNIIIRPRFEEGRKGLQDDMLHAGALRFFSKPPRR
ncbi:MAG TPA: TAXI family TRAP transporter solute-binding subunit [Candidatus Rifleibacterium sp.]|nr:TAXI family TRAP transporter solute-binding subunit [Candidatus Rifleibacterium sp.]